MRRISWPGPAVVGKKKEKTAEIVSARKKIVISQRALEADLFLAPFFLCLLPCLSDVSCVDFNVCSSEYLSTMVEIRCVNLAA